LFYILAACRICGFLRQQQHKARIIRLALAVCGVKDGLRAIYFLVLSSEKWYNFPA
jgi:hypothetical protein